MVSHSTRVTLEYIQIAGMYVYQRFAYGASENVYEKESLHLRLELLELPCLIT